MGTTPRTTFSFVRGTGRKISQYVIDRMFRGKCSPVQKKPSAKWHKNMDVTFLQSLLRVRTDFRCFDTITVCSCLEEYWVSRPCSTGVERGRVTVGSRSWRLLRVRYLCAFYLILIGNPYSFLPPRDVRSLTPSSKLPLTNLLVRVRRVTDFFERRPPNPPLESFWIPSPPGSEDLSFP